MRLGAHISVAGGLYKAFERGRETGCDTMLIFTKSNRQWGAKPLSVEEIAGFRAAAAEYSDIYPVAVHASYLINVGSSDPELWEKSYASLKEEVERAEALAIPLLAFHPGAYISASEEAGLDNIARALRRLITETTGSQVTICLETMAGTGTTLGHRFEQLAYLLTHGHAGQPQRLGICFDTCHVFSAGYDIRSPEAYLTTLAEFDRVIGLDQIKFFHFNDSKHGLGERKDRHEHIGRGAIGFEGFANFINDPRWAHFGAHLETPKTETDEAGQEIEMDTINLAALRELITDH
jgi:deoxyribonuclease-4